MIRRLLLCLLWMPFAPAAGAAMDLTTIEGETFHAVRVTEVTRYTVSFFHVHGAATVAVASVRDADLPALGPAVVVDRSRDGRFWLERHLALLRGYEKSGAAPLGAGLQEALVSTEPYRPLMASYYRELREAQVRQSTREHRARAGRAVLEAEGSRAIRDQNRYYQMINEDPWLREQFVREVMGRRR